MNSINSVNLSGEVKIPRPVILAAIDVAERRIQNLDVKPDPNPDAPPDRPHMPVGVRFVLNNPNLLRGELERPVAFTESRDFVVLDAFASHRTAVRLLDAAWWDQEAEAPLQALLDAGVRLNSAALPTLIHRFDDMPSVPGSVGFTDLKHNKPTTRSQDDLLRLVRVVAGNVLGRAQVDEIDAVITSFVGIVEKLDQADYSNEVAKGRSVQIIGLLHETIMEKAKPFINPSLPSLRKLVEGLPEPTTGMRPSTADM